MYRQLFSTLLLLAMAAIVAVGGMSCGRAPAKPAPLRVLCGSSMAAPIKDIARAFEQAHPVTVEIDLGGSETLLPKVLAGAPADVFVCHDPFEHKVRDGGRLHASRPVALLAPVVCVRPGNPKDIRSLQDLARPGLQIGIGDPRYSTAGEMFVDLLDKRGLKESVMANVTLQARTHGEIAGGLVAGPLDVVVVWNFVPPMYAGKLEVVPLTGAEYAPVRVTVLGLTGSAAPRWRDAFLEFCGREESLHRFEAAGYGRINPSH